MSTPATVSASAVGAPPLGVAVVGLGVIARYYVAALGRGDGARLAAAVDLDAGRLAALEGDVATTTDLAEALARDDVDAVVVTVPNDRHFDVCSAALEAGKHVCCEKPLAPDPDEARALERMASERGLTLFTAFHRRYNANVVQLARRAGEPVRAEVEYHERIEEHCGSDAWYLDPVRCGGGCLADNGPNALDTLDLLLGAPRVVAARVERDARGVDVRAEIELECGERATPARVLLDWGYPFGERKLASVGYADGSAARADMLAGWPGFKSSLFHEYEAIVDDFAAAVASGERRGGDGAAVAELVAEAYRLAAGQDGMEAVAVADKQVASGRFVKLLHHKRDERGMELMAFESRCVRRGEIHEIVTTDHHDAGGGDRIDRVGFLGFAEFDVPGVVERGDVVTVAGRPIGRVLGFDECHFPNHYNVLIDVAAPLAAGDLGLAVGDPIAFAPRGG